MRILAQAAFDHCLFPGSKLPDLARSPPPQNGNELPHFKLHAALESGAEWPHSEWLTFLRVSLARTDARTIFPA
jgi:hypothetical protein